MLLKTDARASDQGVRLVCSLCKPLVTATTGPASQLQGCTTHPQEQRGIKHTWTLQNPRNTSVSVQVEWGDGSSPCTRRAHHTCTGWSKACSSVKLQARSRVRSVAAGHADGLLEKVAECSRRLLHVLIYICQLCSDHHVVAQLHYQFLARECHKQGQQRGRRPCLLCFGGHMFVNYKQPKGRGEQHLTPAAG